VTSGDLGFQTYPHKILHEYYHGLTPSPSPKERGITQREAILWFLKFQTYQKKILREYSHGVDGGDSPLLWRGVRGEANRVNIFTVNILNDNKKIVTPPN
jgi:hypothetical protein